MTIILHMSGFEVIKTYKLIS